MSEEFLSGKAGKLFLRSFLPSVPPRAVKSHSGQYGWAGEKFAAAGFATYALDLRGRGKSDGKRLYADNVSEYVDDLSQVIGTAKSRHPGLPVFLLGHSAGGVVSCIYAFDHQSELKGLICESFAFRVYAPKIALAMIKGLSHIAPNLPVLKLKTEDFSRDPVATEAMRSDPLGTGSEAQPAATVAALVRATERMEKEFPRITIPVFILHGTADKATDPEGNKFFHQTAGSSDKTLKLYEGHYHDLLNDLGKEGVMADITGWIEKRM